MTDTPAICPVCEAEPCAHHLPACGGCWGKVPAHLKTEFYATRRAHETGIYDGAKLAAFELAKAEALAAIPPKETPDD